MIRNQKLTEVANNLCVNKAIHFLWDGQHCYYEALLRRTLLLLKFYATVLCITANPTLAAYFDSNFYRVTFLSAQKRWNPEIKKHYYAYRFASLPFRIYYRASMPTFRKTDYTDKHFQQLVEKLDEELRIRDGDDHLFYAALNKTHNIKYVIVAYENDLPIGCGSIREFSAGIMEIKRMYVEPASRSKGIATAILKQLEPWALELGYTKLVLETGRNQPEAIALYGKNNYHIIPNFGKYENVYNSVCFEKILAKV